MGNACGAAAASAARRPDRPPRPAPSSRRSCGPPRTPEAPTPSGDRRLRTRGARRRPDRGASPELAARRADDPRRPRPRAGSTSSASTPTTTRASSCPPRSTSRSGSPTSRPTTDGSSSSASMTASGTASTSTTRARRRARWLDYVAGTAWALDEAGLPLTGPARRHRLDPATERRPLVVGGHRARLGLGAARRRGAERGPIPPRPDLPARRERRTSASRAA